ncbi:MAG: hypothetical protein IJ825_06200, partial [Oscillospiraceae bacterium]|nr:hypothetical protein [Oscillospiraceae bacterium]
MVELFSKRRVPGACPHGADAHIGVLWSGVSCPRSGAVYRNAPSPMASGAKRSESNICRVSKKAMTEPREKFLVVLFSKSSWGQGAKPL